VLGAIYVTFDSPRGNDPNRKLQNNMKTLHAYVTRLDENTIQFSNDHPSGKTDIPLVKCDRLNRVTSKYWCEDFISNPSPANYTEASYEDVEALVEREGIVDVVLNHCH